MSVEGVGVDAEEDEEADEGDGGSEHEAPEPRHLVVKHKSISWSLKEVFMDMMEEAFLSSKDPSRLRAPP